MNLKLILNHFFLCLGYLFGSNTSNLGIQTHPIISYHLSIIILNFSAKYALERIGLHKGLLISIFCY